MVRQLAARYPGDLRLARHRRRHGGRARRGPDRLPDGRRGRALHQQLAGHAAGPAPARRALHDADPQRDDRLGGLRHRRPAARRTHPLRRGSRPGDEPLRHARRPLPRRRRAPCGTRCASARRRWSSRTPPRVPCATTRATSPTTCWRSSRPTAASRWPRSSPKFVLPRSSPGRGPPTPTCAPRACTSSTAAERVMAARRAYEAAHPRPVATVGHGRRPPRPHARGRRRRPHRHRRRLRRHRLHPGRPRPTSPATPTWSPNSLAPPLVRRRTSRKLTWRNAVRVLRDAESVATALQGRRGPSIATIDGLDG